ncbi:DUF3099 domain-containing protein [Streptomyces globosus]|uniref:DUF3099 domain-containing protein n=1 Tax=Streptomyces globosus TaxID=68209 RepID=A0A344U4L3_9ACTN|nr:DUF3099 domain-containing protein [Streptomyces globosus]
MWAQFLPAGPGPHVGRVLAGPPGLRTARGSAYRRRDRAGASGSRIGRWSVLRKKRNGTEVFRITGARLGLDEDVRGRQRRYVISMVIRTLSVVATVLLWNVERHVAVVTLVAGALLPYVAVVIANAGRESAPKLPSHFIPSPARPALEAGNLRNSSDQS